MQNRQHPKAAVLAFLFQLSFLQQGQDYEKSSLTEVDDAIKEDLAAIGVVYRRKRGSRRFYPTQFSACLAGDAVAWSSAGSGLELAPSAATGKVVPADLLGKRRSNTASIAMATILLQCGHN